MPGRLSRLGLLAFVSLLATFAFGSTARAYVAPTPELKSITTAFTTAHVEATIDPNAGPSTTCWSYFYGEKNRSTKR